MNNYPVHTGWTEERVELATKLWKEGLSASQVAKKVGGGVTRSAIIGKMHRLGVSARNMPSKPAKPKPAPRPNRTFSRIAMTPGVVHVVPSQAAPIRPMPKRDYKPGAHACTMGDLGTHQCRWPLGPLLEPSHQFCGEPLNEDRDLNLPPYCEVHAMRARSPGNGRKLSERDLIRSVRRYAA